MVKQKKFKYDKIILEVNMKIDRLKEIREDKDLLQKDIANILKITQVQYSRYETGIRVIPIYHLEKLAIFYDTSIDYLIGLTDIRKPYPKSILNKE